MAQIASPGDQRRAQPSALTVSDLLNRNAPVPPRTEDDAVEATNVVTVGSLLRREGRAPRAADRPVTPRSAPEPPTSVVPAEDHGPDHRTALRRGAVAAGALLAVGSVFGAAALTDTATHDALAEGDQAYPGQGRLDGTLGADETAAAAGALDPGVAPPSSWVPIAFPSALAAVPAGTGATSATTPSSTAATTGSTSSSSTSSSTSGSSSSSGLVSSLGSVISGSDDSDDSSSGGVGGVVESTTDTLGDTVSSVGDGTVLEPITSGLGEVVSGAGGAVSSALDGVGDTVKSTSKTLESATEPVTKALPVTKPVTNLLFGATSKISTSAPHASSDEDSSDDDRSSEESSSSDDSDSSSSSGKHAKSEDSDDSSSDDSSGSDSSSSGNLLSNTVKSLLGG